LCDAPILKPELSWEKKCIEAPSVIKRGDTLFMFYAGGYNNEPQQIGVASSKDGVKWERLSTEPLLPNGPPVSWNSSESGHPGVFVNDDGPTWLFFQGNNDNGRTWFLSRVKLAWDGDRPCVVSQ
jgi:beta-xylosidase